MLLPVGLDVAGRAPQVGADRGCPLPHRVPAVLAEGVDDGPAGGLERLVHFLVGGDHQAHLRGLVVGRLLLHDFGGKAAQVVLEVVDAPGRRRAARPAARGRANPRKPAQVLGPGEE